MKDPSLAYLKSTDEDCFLTKPVSLRGWQRVAWICRKSVWQEPLLRTVLFQSNQSLVLTLIHHQLWPILNFPASFAAKHGPVTKFWPGWWKQWGNETISGNFLKRQLAHGQSLFSCCLPSGGLWFPHMAAAEITRHGNANSDTGGVRGKGQDLHAGPGQLTPNFTEKRNRSQPLAEAGVVGSFYPYKPKPD